ncbi:hypothetical protein NX801_06945 [Streptomyces sp. LP05-1]|uniref:Uncharacterized protein n=1 Tax=Streptomyces pyxinae TaxID=2970734 RepID=A0ABT2CDA2_9ACTN|nr:hypothetical protein [Streptomyces sp. LP05-1]MCS0635398.1 hypothetical protein [Streptomyces sp. LP05-1]
MPATSRMTRVAVRTLFATSILATTLTAAPAVALDRGLPSHQCTVNGVSVPPGAEVRGTNRKDRIECENDVENMTIWGGGGDDYIRVKGLIIDSQILGGDGDDTIQTSHLAPRYGQSTVRGNNGNDTLIVATVRGTAEHGATVYGDMGNDKITVGSVHGAPGDYARGGGQVFGNDGEDHIVTGAIDFGGRALGGSENDHIEAKSLGAEAGGVIQGGPGQDRISGLGGSVLKAGPGWGFVDGGLDDDQCRVVHASPDRARSTIASCE